MNETGQVAAIKQPSHEDHGGVLAECLLIICACHHLTVSKESLLSGLPLNNLQLSPSGAERAATRAGLTSRTVKREIKQINPALLPAILILQNQQACVLHEVNEHSAIITFPELGHSKQHLAISDLLADYTGYVIFARPRMDASLSFGEVEKKTVGHWLWSTVKIARVLYRDVVIASVFISLLSLALPLFVMNVYDRVVPNAAIETLWALAIGVLIALVADFVLRLVRQYFLELASSRLDVTLSAKIFEKVLGLSMVAKPARSGAFINSLHSFESIRQFFSSLTLVALVDLPFGILFIAVIAMISPSLIIPIVIGAAGLILYAYYAQRIMQLLSDESMSISARKSALVTESVMSLEDIKSFGLENKTQSEWEKQSIFLAKVNAKTRLLSLSVNNTALWLQQSVGVTIILIGVYLVIEGTITQGGLIAAYLLSSRAMGPISQVAGLLAQYHHAHTAQKSLDEIMHLPSDNQSEKSKKASSDLSGFIKFDRVCFHYPDESRLAVQNVSITIKAGEHVAILGKNGCGKSTLNRLLMQFYHPTSGQILLDDVDILQYEASSLRHNIGYVPQQINLFSGSLRDNIVTSLHVDDDHLFTTIKACGLLSLVNSHAEGVDQEVGERGCYLSGGQRQAVGLARAILHNPAFYIMDEPTSSLDSGAELQVKATIERASKGKTLIINTHRSTLLDLVDRVIVLDKGQVIADGRKEDVLAKIKSSSASGKEHE